MTLTMTSLVPAVTVRALSKQGLCIISGNSSPIMTKLITPFPTAAKPALLSTSVMQDWTTQGRSNSTSLYPWQTHSQIRGRADVKVVQTKVKEFREGKFDTIPDPSKIPHFKLERVEKTVTHFVDLDETTYKDKKIVKNADKDKEDSGLFKVRPRIGEVVLPHPIWTEKQVNAVKITHKEPESTADRMALRSVNLMRWGFDLFSGFNSGQRTEKKWLNRICFLETVAGVPGMVAAMMRHMKSLRRLQRDQGWIHTLLEEAENERMHLLIALQLKQPSLFFRFLVVGAQGVFTTMFSAAYLVSPGFCHRFVGYLEEEAVKTYTSCLKDIDEGPLKHWQTMAALESAILYWKLKPNATMKDVIMAIRADESHHSLVNHTFASLKKDEFNPRKPGM